MPNTFRIRYPDDLAQKIQQQDPTWATPSPYRVAQWLRDRYDADLRYLPRSDTGANCLHIEFPNERAALDFVLKYA